MIKYLITIGTILLFLLHFSSCSNDDIEQKNGYFIRYSAQQCSYLKYRDVNGDLVSKSTNTSDEEFFEIGPVSSIFQAYIEGKESNHKPCSINIYVKKNDQAYIKVATQSLFDYSPTGTRSITYNVQEYD